MDAAKQISVLVLAVALVATAAAPSRAEPAAPSAEALVALREFVLGDCATDGDDGALNRLRAHADVLVPELERWMFEGPDAVLADESQRALGEAWERRQAFLDAGGDHGFEPASRLRVRTTSRGEFVARGRERLEVLSREKAAIGLLAIAPAETLRSIRLRTDRIEGAAGDRVRALLGGGRPLGARSGHRRGERRADAAGR